MTHKASCKNLRM